MSFATYFISILLASQITVGAFKDHCDGTKNPIVISTQSDADALHDCTTIKGDVVIDQSVHGNIDIDGIQRITGDLIADGAHNLNSLSASVLSSIGGTFKLHDLVLFFALAMDSLSDVGNLNFTLLPGLSKLRFDNQLRNVGSITIDSTGLVSLDGIRVETVKDLRITYNPRLSNLTMDSLDNVTGSLYICNKDANFPNLITAADLTFAEVVAVALPSLAAFQGKLNVSSAYIHNFSAPCLGMGGSVNFEPGGELNNIFLPELKRLSGDLQISSTGLLEHIDGFPRLSTIEGSLTLVGNYTDLSFPALDTVGGSINATSEYDIDCDTFDTLRNTGSIESWYSCSPGSKPIPPSASSTLSGSTSSSTSKPDDGTIHGPSSTSSAAAAAATTAPSESSSIARRIALRVCIPVVAIAIPLIAAFWFLRRRRRRRRREQQLRDHMPKDKASMSDFSSEDRAYWMSRGKFQELDPSCEIQPLHHNPSSVEAPSPPQPVQLPTSNWLQELPGDMPKISRKS